MSDLDVNVDLSASIFSGFMDRINALGGTIVELATNVDAMATAMARSNNRPRVIPMNASAVADANGNAVLAFDPCAQGRRWSLRRLAVGGAHWVDAAAGTALISVGSSQTQPDNAVPITEVRDYAPTMPLLAFYDSMKEMAIKGGQMLIVTINGGTSGQTYYGVAAVDDNPQ